MIKKAKPIELEKEFIKSVEEMEELRRVDAVRDGMNKLYGQNWSKVWKLYQLANKQKIKIENYDLNYQKLIAERESVLDAFSFLRSNWGTTKGYEKLKEYMSDIELKGARE